MYSAQNSSIASAARHQWRASRGVPGCRPAPVRQKTNVLHGSSLSADIDEVRQRRVVRTGKASSTSLRASAPANSYTGLPVGRMRLATQGANHRWSTFEAPIQRCPLPQLKLRLRKQLAAVHRHRRPAFNPDVAGVEAGACGYVLPVADSEGLLKRTALRRFGAKSQGSPYFPTRGTLSLSWCAVKWRGRKCFQLQAGCLLVLAACCTAGKPLTVVYRSDVNFKSNPSEVHKHRSNKRSDESLCRSLLHRFSVVMPSINKPRSPAAARLCVGDTVWPAFQRFCVPAWLRQKVPVVAFKHLIANRLMARQPAFGFVE